MESQIHVGISATEADERFYGQKVRVSIAQLSQKSPRSHRFSDISLLCQGETLSPGEQCLLSAFVPSDYFGKTLDTSDVPMYIRYLLDEGFDGSKISIKSKFAQAGLDLHADFDPSHSYITLPLEETPDGYFFKMRAWNLNPSHTLQFPEGHLPAFRFFLPNHELRGADLYRIALSLGSDHVMLADTAEQIYTLDQLSLLPPQHTLFLANSTNSLFRVVLEVVREGQFSGDPDTIQLASLIDISSGDRARLDDTLHLDLRQNGRYHRSNDIVNQIYIGETHAIQVPSNVMMVINTHHNFARRGLIKHINSPLIDPSYGLDNEGGKTIRLERYLAGQFDEVSPFVVLACYYA